MLRTPTSARGKARLAAAAVGASAALIAALGTSGSAQAAPAPARHGVMPTVAGAAQFRAQAAHDTATAAAATGPETLSYGGGIDGIGVMDQHPKVYVIFYGSQWGTQSKDANGNLTFSNDPQKGAATAQMLFKGVGTGGESWSGTMTQYCDGSLVKTGATSCPSGAAHVPYPTGGVFAGAWYDNSGQVPVRRQRPPARRGGAEGGEALRQHHRRLEPGRLLRHPVSARHQPGPLPGPVLRVARLQRRHHADRRRRGLRPSATSPSPTSPTTWTPAPAAVSTS